MSMYREFNVGQNYAINTGTKSFDNVANSSYLDITVTVRNSIQEKPKNKFKSRNVSYHSVQCPMPSRLRSKNAEIEIYRTENYFCFLLIWVWNMVCHLEGRHRRTLMENSVQRKIFGSKRDDVTSNLSRLYREGNCNK